MDLVDLVDLVASIKKEVVFEVAESTTLHVFRQRPQPSRVQVTSMNPGRFPIRHHGLIIYHHP